MASQRSVSVGVVPRWEWRTFGERFGDAERVFAALTPEQVAESDELYVLPRIRDASIKVRGGVLDVKRLEHVGDDGLEQWLPVAKSAFPVGAEELVALVELLGGHAPPLLRDEYGLDQLVGEVVEPSPDLVALAVHKRRARYTVGGCMAELSEIRTEHGARRTIAVESEDPARVVAAVRELGFDPARNTSLPRELKALAGFGARRYAAIDVGTNSVKFHLGELGADGAWRTIADRAAVTRLGEGLDEAGRLGDEPVERTVAAIAAMAREARDGGAEAIAAVGTAGLRIAPNRAAVVDAVRERAGVELEVIDGEQEARLAYLAATAGLAVGTGSLAVFDTGGGSSQFTFGRDGRVDERFSVDVGAARFTERFGLDEPVSVDVVAATLAAIAADLGRLDDRAVPDALVGMGGAVTNLAAVEHGLATYDPEIVQGSVLRREDVDRQIELYRTRTAAERREVAGLQPGRAEVILAGACIVRTVLGKLGCDAFTVSDRGLRHGLLAERFGR